MKCRHDPFGPNNSVVVESHWAAGVRLRCRNCGFTSHVTKNGRCTPNAVMKEQIVRMNEAAKTHPGVRISDAIYAATKDMKPTMGMALDDEWNGSQADGDGES